MRFKSIYVLKKKNDFDFRGYVKGNAKEILMLYL